MEIGGHSALEMTTNVYAHVTLEDKREALEKLGDLFQEDENDLGAVNGCRQRPGAAPAGISGTVPA